MIAAAPAAPVIPTAALLTVSLGSLVLFVVAYGLRAGYAFSLGALLHELADKTRGIRWIGGKIADAIEKIDEQVMNALGWAVRVTWTSAAKTFHAFEWVVKETANTTAELARDTYETIAGVVDSVIPDTVTQRVAPVDKRLDRVNQKTDARARAEALARAKGIDRVQRDLLAEKLARSRGIDAVESSLIGRIAGLDRTLTRRVDQVWGYTWRSLRAARARLSRVEEWAIGGAIAAGALAVLTRHFPWWQCTGFRRFARGVCRSPVGSLDWLFLLAGFAVVALDPEQVLNVAEDVTDELGGIILKMTGLPGA